MVVMMYISSKGVKEMDLKDKKRSVKKSLKSIMERVNLDEKNGTEEKTLISSINSFINNIN
jgi:hypothetical protein